MRENDHIRKAAKAAHVPLWKVAAELGVCDTTLTRWLRFPLPKDTEQKILDVIERLGNG